MPDVNTRPLRMLLVEDSEDDAELLYRDLRRGGYELTCRRVDTPEDMRNALETDIWDIVVADHTLPRFSSLEALNLLNETGLDLPFIIVSGNMGEELAVEAMKAGAHDYITKGKLARLLPAIEREMRESQVRRARRQAEALLRYQANHDALTGLYNRREFEARLEQALGSALQEGRTHALGYIDLDQFKIVNDTCGHIAGDELLKQVGLLLKDCVREADILARLGGDEFGMLLENCDMTQASRIAGEMLDSFREFRFNWMDKTFDIGASVGLVSINADSRSAAELMSCADVACYMAKDMGRNRIHEYRIEDADLAKRHGEMHWVAAITKALHESRFRLYGQNISTVGQDDGGRRRYEVLVRMLDESGEVVAPGAFIPAAERYNLMPAIDRWVVERVFNSLAMQHRDDNGVLPMASINLSGTTINEESFLVFVKRRMKELNLPPDTVCFEITETAAITNLKTAVKFMTDLKEFGIRFSLDDFGSGLSSFSYLKTLPVDFLKIDGGFIKDIVHDPIDYAIVDAINKIGHVMGLKTIAEFVENEAIFETLKTLGVDFAQGFWLHKPEPLAAIDT